MLVKDLCYRDDLVFISDTQEVISIKDYLGKGSEDYESFFVKVEDGDYKEVYGLFGIIPYMDRAFDKII